MKTIKIKLYRFYELSKKARQKAIQQFANEYPFLINEKDIIETIEANEYEFTEDGKLF